MLVDGLRLFLYGGPLNANYRFKNDFHQASSSNQQHSFINTSVNCMIPKLAIAEDSLLSWSMVVPARFHF